MPEALEQTETVETVEVTPEAAESTETVETTQPEVLDAAALAIELKSAQDRIHTLNEENKTKRIAADKALEQKLISEGKSKEVAAAAIADRDSYKAKWEALNASSLEDVKVQVAKWPEEAKQLVTISDDADASELRAQIAKVQPIVDKLVGTPAKPGNGAGPTPQGGLGGVNEFDVIRKAAKERQTEKAGGVSWQQKLGVAPRN